MPKTLGRFTYAFANRVVSTVLLRQGAGPALQSDAAGEEQG